MDEKCPLLKITCNFVTGCKYRVEGKCEWGKKKGAVLLEKEEK